MIEHPNNTSKSMWKKLKLRKSYSENIEPSIPGKKESSKWARRFKIWGLGLCIGGLIGLFISALATSHIHIDIPKPFDITVCKEKESHINGKTSSTTYYLVDENGTRLSVDSTVWNSLVSIPECSNTSE